MPSTIRHKATGWSLHRIIVATQQIAGQLQMTILQAKTQEFRLIVFAPEQQTIRFDGGEVQWDLYGFARSHIERRAATFVFHRYARGWQDQVAIATKTRRCGLAQSYRQRERERKKVKERGRRDESKIGKCCLVDALNILHVHTLYIVYVCVCECIIKLQHWLQLGNAIYVITIHTWSLASALRSPESHYAIVKSLISFSCRSFASL